MSTYGNQVQFNVYSTMHNPDPERLPKVYEEWEEQARKVLADGPYYYVAGGAGGEQTMRDNVCAFKDWKIVPRMLRNVEERDMSIELFGRKYASPLLVAPIGVQSIIHPDGDVGTAKAAASLHIPYITSSASSQTMEEIAGSIDASPKWFQLYWNRDREVTKSFVRRAEAAGYEAIVVTLDTPMMAWRERDLQNVYLPFLQGEGIANYLSDPAFRNALSVPPEEDPKGAIAHWSKTFGNPGLTWEDIAFLREFTNLPILLKGILHPEDAALAVEYKVDGIIVSNHGGRQVDGAISAIEALPGVCEAVQGRISVLMDSGIRRGSDVIKALALGADAVLVGRPCMYGLAVAGERGVYEILQNMLADLDITLALTGCTSVGELQESMLQQITP